jgi:hypothetical protein
VKLALPDVAVDFGASAHGAFVAAGGVDLSRRVEADPTLRTSMVGRMLAELGALDLRLGEGIESDFAAGELCRVAGRVALPYPLAATLSSADEDGRPLGLVATDLPRVDHASQFPEWRVATLDGASSWYASAKSEPLGARLGPFVNDVQLTSPDLGPTDPSGFLTLSSWQLLGTVERALELVVAHVTSREQFGKPLSALQSVQFQVADVAVAVHSLRELCSFTLWRLSVDAPGHLVDALALRVHALETSVAALRACHQLHGAIGLCQEHDLSVLNRHAQAALRLPMGLEDTTEHLLAAIATSGFDSLFAPVGEGQPA